VTQGKEAAQKRRKDARKQDYANFWATMIETAQAQGHDLGQRNPTTQQWLDQPAASGMDWRYSVRKKDCQVALYFDAGSQLGDLSLARMHRLRQLLVEADKAYVAELDWQDAPGKQTCFVRQVLSGGYLSPQGEWPIIHGRMLQAMDRLQRAMAPHMAALSALSLSPSPFRERGPGGEVLPGGEVSPP